MNNNQHTDPEERRKTIYTHEVSLWAKSLAYIIASVIAVASTLNLSVSSSQDEKLKSISELQSKVVTLSEQMIIINAQTGADIINLKAQIETLEQFASNVKESQVTKHAFERRNFLIDNTIYNIKRENEKDHSDIFSRFDELRPPYRYPVSIDEED